MVRLKTPVTAKNILYSDFRQDFMRNPLTNDIAKITNEESVKQSIRNLILTNRGERVMRPNLGGGIFELLFETLTPVSLKLIQERIKETIRQYEPRANVIDVLVNGALSSETVDITISFYIVNSETPIEFNILVERLR